MGISVVLDSYSGLLSKGNFLLLLIISLEEEESVQHFQSGVISCPSLPVTQLILSLK